MTASDADRRAHLRSTAFSGRGSRLLLGVLAAWLGVGLTGCRGGEPEGSAPTTSAPSVSGLVQDARGTSEELALDAYRGMWKAYAKAGLTADPNEADLRRYATGAALKTLTDGLAAYRSKGQVLKGEYTSTPQVIGGSSPAAASTLSITDCLDDSKFLVYKTSGERADDKPGGRRLARATVADLGGMGWRVTSFGVQEIGTC